MEKIIIKPIGYIRSPYKNFEDIPIQSKFRNTVQAILELKKQYEPGLKDLNDFSHAFLLYYFHKSKKVVLVGKPYLEDKEHGVFSIRTPHRPNHIGVSVVKIDKIEKNKVYFTGVDMLDGTPLIDIKPYIHYFDNQDNVCSGWVEKHFIDGKIPESVILNKKNNVK